MTNPFDVKSRVWKSKSSSRVKFDVSFSRTMLLSETLDDNERKEKISRNKYGTEY